MSNKNHSGDSAQLSLFDILGLAGNIDSKYSSDEIEEVIGKLRAAKRTAEKHEENERRRRKKEELERKAREEEEKKKHIYVKLPAWIFRSIGKTRSIKM